MRRVLRALYPFAAVLLRPVREAIVRAAYRRLDATTGADHEWWRGRVYSLRRRLYGERRLLRVAPRSNGVRLWVDVSEWEGGNLYFGRTYEPVESEIVRRLAYPGATIIDVGANIGVHAIPASRAVGATGRVYAFEPVPGTFELLRRNVELNGAGNVVLEPSAVGDSVGTIEIAANRESGLSSIGRTGRGTVIGTLSVPCVTLDAYAARHDLAPVALLKVDVEGHEGHVLRGARTLLERERSIAVLAELSPQNFRALGRDPRVVVAWMRSLGFDAWKVGADGLAPLADGCEGENVLFARPGSTAAEQAQAFRRAVSAGAGAGR